MRLPVIDGDNTKIDEIKANEMLDYAYNNGVNYFDTAYPYHGNGFSGHGSSEKFLGKYIEDKRDSVYIATKMPSWLVNKEEDLQTIFDEQLKTLNVEYFDYYMLHTLTDSHFSKLKKLNAFDFLDKQIADGKIRNVGFSFHDSYHVFEEIINYYDWGFCQIQYNFLDVDYQAGTKGLSLAYEKNIDVIIMEPLRGGKLLDLNNEAKNLLKGMDPKRTIADWAFSWLYSSKKLSVVLSGMSTLDQVKENVQIAKLSDEKALSDYEYEVISKVNEIIQQTTKIPCTACGYCMPCPSNVNIPGCFSCYNNYYLFGDSQGAKSSAISQYNFRITKKSFASNCIDCKLCETHCPQNIKISDELKKVAKVLE